jgi:hypothetical protein
VNANISINDLNTKKIFILLKDKPIRLSDVNSIETYINNTNLFYLYYDGDFISEKNFNSLISFLKEKAKEDAKKR